MSGPSATADKFFGLLPLPREVAPFGTSRGPTTQILWLPGLPNPVNCAAAAMTLVFGYTAASIQNFSDYAAVWEEYVVRAVHWRIRAIGTQIGVLKYYVDEADNSSPTATTAGKHVGFIMRCQASSGDFHQEKWIAKDCGDETWTACSNTSKFIVALKCFSNGPNYSLAGTTEPVGFIDSMICVQFRTQGGA